MKREALAKYSPEQQEKILTRMEAASLISCSLFHILDAHNMSIMITQLPHEQGFLLSVGEADEDSPLCERLWLHDVVGASLLSGLDGIIQLLHSLESHSHAKASECN